MGASRKLQGEIDRVLKKVQEGVDLFNSIWNKVYDTDNANQKEKFEADLKKEIKKLQRYRDQIKTWIQSSEIKDKKVSASYEQALVDARKNIEREMERFKICEKETKTKAFSKEGLGQQPKTDPKEKAKSETRDWLNNVVSELESQIDNFEAEIEGFSYKKGKTRPARLIHLETSIVRHKAHIMKLELILRLLDNDELSPEQVNDVKEFLEDYVDRNQDDFEDFDDVDELYSSLPLDKVEALEDLVSIGPPGLVKGAPVINVKSPVSPSLSVLPVTSSSTHEQHEQNTTVQDQIEEIASQEIISDIGLKTSPPKSNITGSSVASTPTTNNPNSTVVNVSSQNLPTLITASSTLQGPSASRGTVENTGSSSPVNLSTSVKEDDISNFSAHRSSPSLSDTGLIRGIGRGGLSNQPSSVIAHSSANVVPGTGTLGAVPTASDITKRNILGADDRLGSGINVQPVVSPLSNRMILPPASKISDGTVSIDSSNANDTPGIGGRVFSPSVVSSMQWRPGSTFQNQSESGQFRGRTEIAPDQRENYLQRLQQVQQQGHSNLLGMLPLAAGNHKQFSVQPQSSILQQFNSQNSSVSLQSGLGLGVQTTGLNSVASSSLQQQTNSIHQQSSQQGLMMPTAVNDIDLGSGKLEEPQQLQNLPEDTVVDSVLSTGRGKNIVNEDDSRVSYAIDSPRIRVIQTPSLNMLSLEAVVSGSSTEPTTVARDTDLSPGQPVQSSQPSGSLGVIGRRSVADLGAIGNNLSGPAVNSAGMHDQLFNLQMLEAAYHKLPQPKDSERPRSYTPRHPAITPASYPQVQAPVVSNPAFWERLGLEPYGTDTLFFAFYYQPSTYQQYLAARELKKQSWRYHRKYQTWFQRHEEPKVATDEYEQGTYVYFDFHINNDDLQHGWCQRIKTEFTFEYNYLEDELNV